MIKRISIIFGLVWCLATGLAQTRSEQIFAVTDRSCYMAGEVLCVRVDAFANDSMPSASRVAYVEIADQRQMYAQAMVTLTNGQGWAEIPLPMQMHSGSYELTAFTRDMTNYGRDCYFRTVVGVVNGEKISRRDNLTILPFSRYSLENNEASRFLDQTLYDPGATVTLNLKDPELRGCAVSVERISVTSHLGAGTLSVPSDQRLSENATPEMEGHIVRAEVTCDSSVSIYLPRMALIGKTASIYDGQAQPDGTYLYYTSEVNGTLPTLVSAYDWYGNPITMRLKSPYQPAYNKNLPDLVVYSDEDEILQRTNAARQQAAVVDYLRADTLSHSTGFYTEQPDYFYDLDEYTQMSSIKEILVEFVRGVRREKHNGVNMLYTFDPDTRRYSQWPALVLLDGMPVYNIDEILAYDSHLVKYVQIYSGRFFFGATCCQGVISFVTHKGRLSNYKLDAGSRLMSYAFPQNRPEYVNHTGNVRSTLLWQPHVQAESLTFAAPSVSGRYLVTIQGLDRQRKPFFHQSEFFVTAKKH